MQKIRLHFQYIQSADLQHNNIISSFFIYKSNNASRK